VRKVKPEPEVMASQVEAVASWTTIVQCYNTRERQFSVGNEGQSRVYWSPDKSKLVRKIWVAVRK